MKSGKMKLFSSSRGSSSKKQVSVIYEKIDIPPKMKKTMKKRVFFTFFCKKKHTRLKKCTCIYNTPLMFHAFCAFLDKCLRSFPTYRGDFENKLKKLKKLSFSTFFSFFLVNVDVFSRLFFVDIPG